MITVAMYSFAPPMIDLRVSGDRGMLKVLNPTQPALFNRVSLKPVRGRTRVRDPLARSRAGLSGITQSLWTSADERPKHMRVRGESTYWYQLRAFVDAVRKGTPVLTGPEDAVKNMEVIDAIYRAAGLQPRSPTP